MARSTGTIVVRSSETLARPQAVVASISQDKSVTAMNAPAETASSSHMTGAAASGVMFDAFKKLDEVRVVDEPFPHVVIEDILPAELCDQLIRQMPPIEVLTAGEAAGSNKRFNLSCAHAQTASGVSALWRDVLLQGSSQQFLDRVLALFGPSIRTAYPDFADRFGPVESLKAVPRDGQQRRPGTVRMDTQIALNSPALTAGTSVRTAHLDRTDKLFIGLLYLRMPEDDSTGADLEFLSPTDADPLFEPKRFLPEGKFRRLQTVPYRSNKLVLFLNTPWSLHAVTPRQATRHARYFINLLGELPEPLFDVRIRQEPTPARQTVFGRFWQRLSPAGRSGAHG
jgi:hypothetical protein